MKPSFLHSTLSLAFMLCVLTVIVMVFLWLEMPDYWNEAIVWIITAYLTARWTNTKTEDDHANISINKLNNE